MDLSHHKTSQTGLKTGQTGFKTSQTGFKTGKTGFKTGQTGFTLVKPVSLKVKPVSKLVKLDWKPVQNTWFFFHFQSFYSSTGVFLHLFLVASFLSFFSIVISTFFERFSVVFKCSKTSWASYLALIFSKGVFKAVVMAQWQRTCIANERSWVYVLLGF